MIKYINRDALVHTLMDKGFYPIIVRNAIEATTVTDVAPIIHARWHYTDAYPHGVYCSNCNRKFLHNMEWIGIYDIPTKYCPNCGALMDEGEDEK